MGEWDEDDLSSDETVGTALRDVLTDRRRRAAGPAAEDFLWIASALLMGANLMVATSLGGERATQGNS
jgi:hypothetical protein